MILPAATNLRKSRTAVAAEMPKRVWTSSRVMVSFSARRASIASVRLDAAGVGADGSYLFRAVPVGSYTLSFAGNDAFRAASVQVKIADADPWVNLKLTAKNAAPDYTPGDVDGDGKISSADARLALRRSVRLEDYPEDSRAYYACDADFDGNVTSGDARLILRASVGLEEIN